MTLAVNQGDRLEKTLTYWKWISALGIHVLKTGILQTKCV